MSCDRYEQLTAAASAMAATCVYVFHLFPIGRIFHTPDKYYGYELHMYID